MLTNSSSEFSSVLAVVNGARSTSLPVRVGYRGFIVIFALEDGSSISQTFGHAKQMSTTLETALLNSHGSVPSNEIIAIATATINVLVSIASDDAISTFKFFNTMLEDEIFVF